MKSMNQQTYLYVSCAEYDILEQLDDAVWHPGAPHQQQLDDHEVLRLHGVVERLQLQVGVHV